MRVILSTNFSFVCLFVVEVGVVSTGKRINDKKLCIQMQSFE